MITFLVYPIVHVIRSEIGPLLGVLHAPKLMSVLKKLTAYTCMCSMQKRPEIVPESFKLVPKWFTKHKSEASKCSSKIENGILYGMEYRIAGNFRWCEFSND